MEEEIFKDFTKAADGIVEALKRDLGRIRTGRANLNMLDGVRLEYYGTPSPLNQVASCAVADARLITIRPWEKSLIPQIEKAILQSGIGVTPQSDGEIIRLPIPPLTEERRKEFVKQAKGRAEDAKVALRNQRRDSNELLKELEGDRSITEDDLKRHLAHVQKDTDRFVAIVDDVLKKKEAEIMEI